MKPILKLSVWLLLLVPPLCWADALSIPEVGVKFSDLPPPSAAPEVFLRPGATEAVTAIGAALLSVRREDAAVAAGASLSDPDYRAKLQARFDPTLDPEKARGARMAVGGNAGWTLIDAYKDVHSPSTIYTCIAYVIVDGHLYRFMVRAVGTQARPVEFDAAVKAIADVAFASPPASTGVGAGTSSRAVKLPPSVDGMGTGMVGGLKLNTQLLVDVEFSLDAQGHAQSAKVLHADSSQNGALGLAYLQGQLFGVPADWEASNSQKQRFALEFQFSVVAAGAPCQGAASAPRIPGTRVVHACMNGMP